MVHWFQGSLPDGCLGDEVLTGDLSLGLIYKLKPKTSSVISSFLVLVSQFFSHFVSVSFSHFILSLVS